MRIVALIIGLIFGFWIMIEGLLVSTLFDMGNSEEDSNTASLGFVAGFVTLIGAPFAIAFPLVSMVLFGLATLMSLGAASSGYSNHWVYMVILFSLTVFSYFGWRGKRRDRREFHVERKRQIDRDDRMEQLLAERQGQVIETTAIPAGGIACANCGHTNTSGTKFCAECGSNLLPEIT